MCCDCCCGLILLLLWYKQNYSDAILLFFVLNCFMFNVVDVIYFIIFLRLSILQLIIIVNALLYIFFWFSFSRGSNQVFFVWHVVHHDEVLDRIVGCNEKRRKTKMNCFVDCETRVLDQLVLNIQWKLQRII